MGLVVLQVWFLVASVLKHANILKKGDDEDLLLLV